MIWISFRHRYRKYLEEWHRCFAWYPKKIGDRDIWLDFYYTFKKIDNWGNVYNKGDSIDKPIGLK